jgi:hypothetical protein
MGPVVFVYGSESPSTWRVNREVAEHFGRYYPSAALEYPVLADRQLTREIEATHALVLVGTASDNSVLRRLGARLPIQSTPTGIAANGKEYTGEDIGAVFIHPNPELPERYVVVITAPTLGGMQRALSLPALLPDFVIYDRALRAAAAQQVLGDADVRAAGFFTSRWTFPP